MKCTVAIEIGNHWLKLIAVDYLLKSPQISKIAVRSVASLSDEHLPRTISRLLKELRLHPAPLIVSLSRNLSTLRNLRFPSVDPTEIRGMVDIYISKQIPYTKEEIVSDYQIIGTDEAGYAKIILAIVQRDTLRRLFNILDQARLYPGKVGLGSYGVWAQALFSQGHLIKNGYIYFLLDIDNDFTDFIIFSKDNLLFSRSIAQQQKGLRDEAKRRKFIGEIKQSLVIFQAGEMTRKPAGIFLSGAGENIQEIKDSLTREFNLPVEIISDFGNLTLSKEIAGDYSAVPKDISISAAVGLALDVVGKNIVFTLPEIQLRNWMKKRTKQLLGIASLVIYILIIVCGIFLGRIYNRQAYLEGLRERFEKIKQETDSLARMSKEINIVKGRLDSENSAINYLYVIHKLLPTEAVVTAITFEEAKRIVLRGYTQQMSDIFKFISTLEDSVYFQNIQLRHTSKKKIEGQEVSEFEIVLPLTK